MLILTGKNLKERQKDLNKKVNDAANEKIDFRKVEHEPEQSDIDKLFKIDLAAKCKNIEYVLEVLKSGDPLYISRVLGKCTWLYEKDFTMIINSDYLSENIFPSMSIKMRNKLLTTVSTHLENGDERVIGFFTFCMKMKLHNIALKFLLCTPESFKLDVIVTKSKAFKLVKDKDGEYLKYFTGDSFILAENYIKHLNTDYEKSNAIYLLRYMYSVSNKKYLDIVETCDENGKTFGRRLSKHIIQNYKERVMKKPLLYASVLNKNIVSRNITIDDAKVFAIALLPKEPFQFFSIPYSCKKNYCLENQFVLDLIPAEERFSFVKKLFTEKYPGQSFETCSEFYSSDCYKIMTPQEIETWALSNIASQNEILGSGNDYLWYKFVNFETAMTELKKLIMKTTENTKRCEQLGVLIDSAKNEKDLIKLLNYYSDRHRNEVALVTEQFLDKLIDDHKVWRFGEECWTALENIFYISKVFDKLRHSEYRVLDYRVLAFMYYVVNKKPVPDILNEFLDKNVIRFYTIKKYLTKLEPDTEIIIDYILQFYAKKIEVLSKMPHENDTKKIIKRYIHSAMDLLQLYEKTKNDLPEIMLAYIKLDLAEYEHHVLLADKNALSSNDIMHYLKEDAKLVVHEFPKIKKYIESSSGNINWLIRKLSIYFSHDISKEYLSLFNDCLTDDSLHYTTADVVVRGIITLSGLTSRIEFLEKYRPQDKKIDLAKMASNTFYVQKAICRQMHCSRPPLPLLNIFQYVIGDYVQYCLALFRWYLLNLPYPICVQFVESLIDKPVSIQKHGLRLAFECFDEEKLKTIILDCWTKTKNVSLRMILYKSLYMKILSEDNIDTQLQLFEVFITLTSGLNENENENFQLVRTTNFPSHLIGRYLKTAWETVSKFSDRTQNLALMVKIIKDLERSICLLSDIFINEIVENHIQHMLDEEQILNAKLKRGFDDLLESKWHLTISNLAYVENEKKLIKNSSVINHIVKRCVAMWDKRNENNVYVIRQFLNKFIDELDSKSYDHEENSHSNVIVLLKSLKQHLKEVLPEKDIYMYVWKLQSSIITKKVILEPNLHMETKLNDGNALAEMKRSGILLGKEFGLLIKKNAEKGTFYRMFYEQFESIVTTVIDNIIAYNCKVKCDGSVLLSSTDILILFCLGLLEHQIPETYMFALYLLPLKCNDNEIHFEDYIMALKKIQDFENKEIQCYVYEKFVNNDFEYRNYLL